jgi:hypothetical protein
MVTGGGRGGLQQCNGGQGGVRGLQRGAPRAEERQGEGEGKRGHRGSPVEAERGKWGRLERTKRRVGGLVWGGGGW